MYFDVPEIKTTIQFAVIVESVHNGHQGKVIMWVDGIPEILHTTKTKTISPDYVKASATWWLEENIYYALDLLRSGWEVYESKVIKTVEELNVSTDQV